MYIVNSINCLTEDVQNLFLVTTCVCTEPGFESFLTELHSHIEQLTWIKPFTMSLFIRWFCLIIAWFALVLKRDEAVKLLQPNLWWTLSPRFIVAYNAWVAWLASDSSKCFYLELSLLFHLITVITYVVCQTWLLYYGIKFLARTKPL